MTFQEALDYISSAYKMGRKLGLDNIKELLERLGNPQEGMKIIHVAGTNGKGSTSAMISKMLEVSGYRVGFYSSPHLETYRERMRINSELISEDSFALVLKEVLEAVSEMENHPTEFELLTAMALVWFRKRSVDYAVMEVGLGGRLDATNAIHRPLLCVITPIGLDHVKILGNTISQIASEKAGIIKDGIPVVTSPQEPDAIDVIRQTAALHQAPLTEVRSEAEIIYSDLSGSEFIYQGEMYRIHQVGKYQIENALTAIEAAKQAGLTIAQIKKGLEKFFWEGRLEKIQSEPDIYLDGSHNGHGAKTLVETFGEIHKTKRLIGVLGMLEDKDSSVVVDLTAPLFDVMIATEPHSNKAQPAQSIADLIRRKGVETLVIEDLREAIRKAKEIARPEDIIVCYGSFYLIGDLRTILKDKPRTELQGPLVLASASKRRIEFLKPLFEDLIIDPSDIDETILDVSSPELEVMNLALKKAVKTSKRYENGVVIGADTIVYLDGIYGKPTDIESARRMILALQGKTHKVITGFAICDVQSGRKLVDYDVAEVTMKALRESDIDQYLEKAYVLDKAGAYAIQEEGRELITEVRGDINTVIGLPLSKVLMYLKDEFAREPYFEKNTAL